MHHKRKRARPATDVMPSATRARTRFLGVGVPVFVVLASVACGERPAQPAQACPGVRSDLFAYAGTYQSAEVLADSEVARKLAQLLGTERDHLEENLAVSGSIDLIACHLVISGNAERQGGSETGIVAVSLGNGSVSAAIQSAPVIRVYSEAEAYLGVPLAVRDWVAVAAGSFESRFDLPTGTELVSPDAR